MQVHIRLVSQLFGVIYLCYHQLRAAPRKLVIQRYPYVGLQSVRATEERETTSRCIDSSFGW